MEPIKLLMDGTVDDDVKVVFTAVAEFISKYGYTNANFAGFTSPTGITMTVNAALPDGGNYTYNQFIPHAPAPAAK